MKILIVGAGALGGTVACRLFQAGLPVHLAVRTREQADALRAGGLRLKFSTGEIRVCGVPTAALDDYSPADNFDLILLAAKAADALAIARRVLRLLSEHGTIVALQNGCAQLDLANQLGRVVLGGIVHLGARMANFGNYEQGNRGSIILAEPLHRRTERAEAVALILRAGLNIDVSANFREQMWAKLAINCSVTAVSALVGCPVRGYVATSAGRALLLRAHMEAIAVATKLHITPHPLTLEEISARYADLRPSMLQDIDRGRKTEVDFINGYVVREGRRLSVPTPVNAAIVERVLAIEDGREKPGYRWEDIVTSQP